MTDAGDDVVELAADLISFPSVNPPGEEAAVVAALRERLADSPAGFDVATQVVDGDRANVVARAGDPDRGTVLLSGHVDVVPATATDWTRDPFDPAVVDGRLVGRGAADMKGAIAAMVLAAESYLREADEPGEVVLAFVVGEEVGGVGTAALVDRGIAAGAAIVGEPSELAVAIAQKGVVRYDVEITGRASHSGRPDAGRSAIRGLWRVCRRLEAFDRSLRRSTSHPSLRPETATVTLVEGGVAENVVPDRATCHVDWRIHPGSADPAAYDRRIDAAIGEISLAGEPLPVAVERNRFLRGAEVPADAPVVTAISDACRAVGHEPAITGFDAVTDARFFVHEAGIPTAVFGPGSITDDAHTVDESVAVADLQVARDVYRQALHRLFESDAG